MKALLNLFFVVSALAALVVASLACTCLDHSVPVCQYYKDAEAVFVGKVERITSAAGEKKATVSNGGVNSISWWSVGLVFVHFKIESAFKGVQGTTVKALTYRGTSCDLEIKKGQRWVIFAHKDDETGFLSFGACGGNHEVERGSDTIKELQKLSQGTPELSVAGHVALDRYADVKDAKVSIEGNGISLLAQTGGSGYYNFIVPKPGIYRVKVVVPFSASVRRFESRTIEEKPSESETVFEYDAVASPESCDYQNLDTYRIDLKATASIAGRFDHTGWYMFPRFYPDLCRLKATEKETLSTCRLIHSLKMDGTFAVTGLREGTYVIVYNEEDLPDGSHLVLRHYYPGVRNFADATPIVLEQGQALEGLRFSLPPQLPMKQIKGQVFDRKGAPLALNANDGEPPDIRLHHLGPLKYMDRVDFVTSWGETSGRELIRMIKVEPDGTFSLTVFHGYDYLIMADVETPSGVTRRGFLKIKADRDLREPVKIILDRTDDSSAEEYLAELEKKARRNK